MKTNRQLLILIALVSSLNGLAQQVVFDPAVLSTLVINHEAQQNVLVDIKEKETAIATAQTTIATQMAVIRELKQKVYNSMRNVSAIVRDSRSIIYAIDIAKDIGEYQGKMVTMASGDPVLTIVAVQAEAELISRTAALFTFIYTTAIVGGDFNLMDNKQRLDIIRHVVNELRIMRGIAYGIYRRMTIAKRAGILRTINPFQLNYPNSGAAIVSSLLNEIR
jgi:hypothetical protein